MLFNIALEKAVREANLDIRGTILHKSVQILAYADNVVIVEDMKMQLNMPLINLRWQHKKCDQWLLIMIKQNTWEEPAIQLTRNM
jgi:hypothetical protein